MKHDQSTTLRRVMKALGFTNQSLADKLSSYRSDGKRTSAATVSRWISGAAPIRPTVLACFHSVLVTRLVSRVADVRVRRRMGMELEGLSLEELLDRAEDPDYPNLDVEPTRSELARMSVHELLERAENRGSFCTAVLRPGVPCLCRICYSPACVPVPPPRRVAHSADMLCAVCGNRR